MGIVGLVQQHAPASKQECRKVGLGADAANQLASQRERERERERDVIGLLAVFVVVFSHEDSGQ